MDTNDVIEKIKSGLKKYSEKYQIPAKDIGINLCKSISNGMVGRKEELKINILNERNIAVMDVDLSEFLNINPGIAFLAKGGILKKLTELANKNKPQQLNIDTVNATIYTQEYVDFTPSIRLQEETKIIRELKVADLI